MNYVFDFSWIAAYSGQLGRGVLVTLGLAFAGTLGGAITGLGLAWILTWGPRWPRPLIVGFIEIIRNTPFLIQLFFVFFGLPQLGIMIPSAVAAVITTILALAAYSAEIFRAGIESTPKSQVEAGRSLAMSRGEVFRHVVLVPALERIWPALASQFIIIMLGTAVVSQIAVEDLTYVATFIQSRNFRAFETYIVSMVIYLALAMTMRFLLDRLGQLMFPRSRRRG